MDYVAVFVLAMAGGVYVQWKYKLVEDALSLFNKDKAPPQE